MIHFEFVTLFESELNNSSVDSADTMTSVLCLIMLIYVLPSECSSPSESANNFPFIL
jgi:hypothetical protein